jgi:hypothetical protein
MRQRDSQMLRPLIALTRQRAPLARGQGEETSRDVGGRITLRTRDGCANATPNYQIRVGVSCARQAPRPTGLPAADPLRSDPPSVRGIVAALTCRNLPN